MSAVALPADLFPPCAEWRERIAVIDGDRRYRYQDVWGQAATLEDRLDRLALPPNTRVAVLLPNSVQAVAALLAIVRLAHCCLPLNVGLKSAELAAIFARCKVSAAFCDRSTAGRLPAGVKALPVERVLPDQSSAEAPNTDASAAAPCGTAAAPARDFVCLSTSGSSGEPRLAVRSAGAVAANLERVADALQVTPEDRFLAVVPFWHANGFSNCLLLPMARGASIVTMGRFLPRQALETIVDQGVTVVVGSPFVFKALSQVVGPGGESRSDLAGVRAWISSGAALPTELDERLRGQGIEARQLYGSSETGTICISGAACREPGSVGHPLAGVEVRIVDEQGLEVPADARGEIEVRSNALFEGYFGEASRSRCRSDGFYRTGDLGRWNRAGEIVLLGRCDAMINVSGVKVDPREVQAVLESLPEIDQALVHGTRDAAGLTRIRAVLVRNADVSTEEVLAYCRGRLAEYKLPRVIEFVDEIPQDLMGKTARRLMEN